MQAIMIVAPQKKWVMVLMVVQAKGVSHFKVLLNEGGVTIPSGGDIRPDRFGPPPRVFGAFYSQIRSEDVTQLLVHIGLGCKNMAARIVATRHDLGG